MPTRVRRLLAILLGLTALAGCELVANIHDRAFVPDEGADAADGASVVDVAPRDGASIDATAKDAGADATVGPPSCRGLAPICGDSPEAGVVAQDCCESRKVPGGSFIRGYGTPIAASATIDDFALDVFEVSVARFRRFYDAYPSSRPAVGSGKNKHNADDPGWRAEWNAALPADQDALVTSLHVTRCFPFYTFSADAGATANTDTVAVVCVPWPIANAFCIWDGGRLPTEAELSYAAFGGGEERTVPWSVPPSASVINLDVVHYNEQRDEGACIAPYAVGYGAPGKWGHMDLAGNVAEWTLDLFGPSFLVPCVNCANLDAGASEGGVGFRTVLGGDVCSGYSSVLNSARRSAQSETMMGIRCARDL